MNNKFLDVMLSLIEAVIYPDVIRRASHLYVESKNYNKLVNVIKKKTDSKKEQTSGCQCGEGRWEEQCRGRG